MDNSYTRLRANNIAGGGVSVTYSVDMDFTLIGGRYSDEIKPSIKEEMRIAGCDTIDLLHIPSWDKRCCQPEELKSLLKELQPSYIEIPMYHPEDSIGKDSLGEIKAFCDASSVTELREMTPKMIRNINDSHSSRLILSSGNSFQITFDNDVVGLFNQGRFSVLNTGFIKTDKIVEKICQRELPSINIMILNDGAESANEVWATLIKKKKPTILIDTTNNSYYILKDTNPESMGISTRKTERGDILIFSGIRRIESEIDANKEGNISGMKYKTESV